jgi:hypothetical protein
MPLTGTVAEFARSTGVASEDKVSVISESSSRHFIPGISRVMEIKSAKPYDSSVAGAGFFSGSDLLGLVSHQYLQIHPGSSTRPMRWSPVISGSSNEVSDHLVVIGINDIVKWLQSPVDQDSRLTLPADQSFSPVTTLQSGNLLFTEDCPPLDASVPHDGYPIGGGDPYGIGGDGVTYRACRVSLRLAATPSSLFFNENWRAWHDDMVTVLKNGLQASVEVRFQRDPQTQKPGRDYIYSAESLFQLMKENSGSYLSVAQDPKTGNFGSAASLRNFRSQAELVNAGSRKIYMDLQAGDVRIGELLRQLYLISEVSKSEQWNLLQKQDFTDLLDPQGVHAWAWQAIQQLVAGGPALRVNFEKLFQEWTQLHP